MPAMVRAQTSAETSTPGIVVYGRTRCPVAAERWIASSSRWRWTACAKSGADVVPWRQVVANRGVRVRDRVGGCSGQVREGVVPVGKRQLRIPGAHGDGHEVRMARGGHFERPLGAVDDQREPGPRTAAQVRRRGRPRRARCRTRRSGPRRSSRRCPASRRGRPAAAAWRSSPPAPRARRRPSSPRRSRVRTRSSAASPRSGDRACTACARTRVGPSPPWTPRRSRTAPRRWIRRPRGRPASGRSVRSVPAARRTPAFPRAARSSSSASRRSSPSGHSLSTGTPSSSAGRMSSRCRGTLTATSTRSTACASSLTDW